MTKRNDDLKIPVQPEQPSLQFEQGMLDLLGWRDRI